MKVKDIMKAPVISAKADAAVTAVAELLTRHHISAVPIVDDGGAVVGLVSQYDLMAKSGATAADIMTPGVISVTEDTDVEDVRHLLLDRRIRRVPVLSGNKLAGIVSRTDIVALMALEWVCQVCGEPIRGERPPETCPRCSQPRAQFVQQQQLPGE